MKRFTSNSIKNEKIYEDLALSMYMAFSKKNDNEYINILKNFINETKSDNYMCSYTELICGIYARLAEYEYINNYDENNIGNVNINSDYYKLGKQFITYTKNSCKKNSNNIRLELFIKMANTRFNSKRINNFSENEWNFLNTLTTYNY